MHGRQDCDDCFLDSVHALWHGRTGAGLPVLVRENGGWVEIAYANERDGVRHERVLPLNPLYTRRLASALIEASEKAERNAASVRPLHA